MDVPGVPVHLCAPEAPQHGPCLLPQPLNQGTKGVRSGPTSFEDELISDTYSTYLRFSIGCLVTPP